MITIKQKINTFWLVLNYACNFRCDGCYAHVSKFKNFPMPFELAVKIIEWMKEMGARDCLLIGGEPTLYQEIIELVAHGTQIGMEMKLVTNGRKLANEQFFQKLLESGLKHASISIEGAIPETHNYLTNTKSFDQVVKAIDNCVKYGLSFNTLMTISRGNYQEVVKLAEFLHSRGVVNILYNIGLPSPLPTNDLEKFLLSPSEVAVVLEDAYLELKRKGIKVKFFATIPLCLIKDDILTDMIKDDYITDGIHCHIFYGTGVAFEANGNVIPCTHFVKKPLFNIYDCNIKTAKDFSRVWYGKEGIHGTFKRALWKYPHKKCQSCEYWGKCIGGCPFLWTYYKPSKVIVGRG